MPITPEQRAARRFRIGASDMPAILGLMANVSPREVWASKVYDVEDKGTVATRAGNALEESLVAYAEDRLGEDVERNVYCDTGQVLAANLDGLCRKLAIGVEGKTHGIVGPALDEDYWGDDETDQVPERVIVQAHAQMVCADIDTVVVPSLVGGRGYRMYRLRRDEDLARMILEEAEEFWTRYVEARVEPPGAPPRLDFIRRVVRQEGKKVSIPEALMVEIAEAKALAKAAKQRKDRAEAAIYAALGDATTGESPVGSVTLRTVNRKEFVTKASSHQRANWRFSKELTARFDDSDEVTQPGDME